VHLLQLERRRITLSSYHIKTWQLTTSADQLRTYKIDVKFNIKHTIATKCENNVLKTGRSLDVILLVTNFQSVRSLEYTVCSIQYAVWNKNVLRSFWKLERINLSSVGSRFHACGAAFRCRSWNVSCWTLSMACCLQVYWLSDLLISLLKSLVERSRQSFHWLHWPALPTGN